MKIVKSITLSTFVIFALTISGLLFINLFFASQVIGAEIQVVLINPSHGTLLSGDIYANAQTNSPVSKVEFYFLDEGGRFTFAYEGINIGDNIWEYTWSTDESIDGVYRVHAVAVDSNNSTYLSDINRIYVDNAGGSIPDFDQNSNSTPPGNYNVNQNININQNINTNTNESINENVNENANTNLNSSNVNSNTPSNVNQNINTNTTIPVNENINVNNNSNAPVSISPDSDNDGLPDSDEIEIGTDKDDPDTDDDGLTDGFEDEYGFNPLIDDNNTPFRTPNQEIIQAITDARFSGVDKSADSDNDGIPDTVETLFGSDPNNPDTSGDGLTDGFKAQNGYSLLNDNSGHIAKNKLDLPNPELSDVEKSSLTSTVAIFGVLLLIVIIVLVIFRPKKVE
jgi:hypothetical protein